MATFDFPSSLKPSAAAVQLNRIAQTFRSPFGGSPQVGDVLSERWQLSLTFPPDVLGDSGTAESLAMRLAGGFNRVRVSHPVRPEPLGTLRGSPRLDSSVSAGAMTIVIKDGLGANLLRNSSMENDADSNGSADGWATYVAGSSGTITRTLVAGRTGGLAQRVSTTSLGSDYGDRAGIQADTTVAVPAGQMVTASAWLKGTDNKEGRVAIDFLNGAGSAITSLAGPAVTLSSTEWRRGTVTLVAPDAVASVRVRIWLNAPIAGPCHIIADDAQAEYGSVATDWQQGGGTLEPGDIIGLNGQWLQVADRALPDINDKITVPLVNRLRNAVSANAAITWNQPTILMAAPGQAGAVAYSVGVSDGLALDLEEVW